MVVRWRRWRSTGANGYAPPKLDPVLVTFDPYRRTHKAKYGLYPPAHRPLRGLPAQ